MSVLGTTKHFSCNCIDTWQYSCIVICFISDYPGKVTIAVFSRAEYHLWFRRACHGQISGSSSTSSSSSRPAEACRRTASTTSPPKYLVCELGLLQQC